jgi:hypothetical protein
MGTLAGLATFNETVSHFSEHPPGNSAPHALPEDGKGMRVGGDEQ